MRRKPPSTGSGPAPGQTAAGVATLARAFRDGGGAAHRGRLCCLRGALFAGLLCGGLFAAARIHRLSSPAEVMVLLEGLAEADALEAGARCAALSPAMAGFRRAQRAPEREVYDNASAPAPAQQWACYANVMFIGASKCGTSTMRSHLRAHPSVRFVARQQTGNEGEETHRFDRASYVKGTPLLLRLHDDDDHLAARAADSLLPLLSQVPLRQRPRRAGARARVLADRGRADGGGGALHAALPVRAER